MQFSGVVLNGGNSSRMGTNKSGIDFKEGRLIDVALNALKGAGAAEVIIVGGDIGIAHRSHGASYCKDLYPSEGPLGGIITALTYSKFEIVITLACDHMYLTAEIIGECLSQLENYEISCPVIGDTKQVLCSVWRKSALNQLQDSYSSGNRSVMHAIERMRCRSFKISNPDLLRTANTPDELSE